MPSSSRSGFNTQSKPRDVNRSDLLKAYDEKMSRNQRSQQLLATQKPPRETGSAKYHQYIKGHTRQQLAGENMSKTVEKLSDEHTFTGMYKQRLVDRDGDGMLDIRGPGTGELCSSPKRAMKLLKSTPVAKLNMPGRSGDYRNEVEWRLQLRPNLNN
jgi:hypothetical protein